MPPLPRYLEASIVELVLGIWADLYVYIVYVTSRAVPSSTPVQAKGCRTLPCVRPQLAHHSRVGRGSPGAVFPLVAEVRLLADPRRVITDTPDADLYVT
jgi:hypothetical protein